MHHLAEFKDWIVHLGKRHHVNPVVFGALYVTGKLAFLICIGWAFRNFRAGKSYLVTLLVALIGYCLPMLYIVIAGRHIPVLIYVFIGLLIAYAGFVAWKKLKVSPAG